MTDWTDGYVNEINYTYGYYSQLNPNNLVIPFLHAGLKPPQVRTACELGFGQGVSLNNHAAASTVQWYGNDFNPSQAHWARDLAERVGHGPTSATNRLRISAPVTISRISITSVCTASGLGFQTPIAR